MPSFKRFYMEKRKKTIQSRKNGAKLLQLAMISCSYNFIKLSMCSYNFNVANHQETPENEKYGTSISETKKQALDTACE